MATFICHEMNKHKLSDELYKFVDKAAEFGAHSAIQDVISRHTLAIQAVMKSNSHFAEMTAQIDYHVNEIISQANRLGGLYWSVGHLRSAILLLQAASVTYQAIDKLAIERSNMTQTKLDENLSTIKLLNLAIKHAIFSQFLEHHAVSLRVTQVLSPEGLLKPYADKFDGWPQAQQYLFECCQGFSLPNPQHFIQASVVAAQTELGKLNVTVDSSAEAKRLSSFTGQ